MSRPTNLAILGSTGSVGSQSLEVLRHNPGMFKVEVLAAGRNIEVLAAQVEELKPRTVVVSDEDSRQKFAATPAGRSFLQCGRVLTGPAGLSEAVTLPEVDAVVVAITGFAAFQPLIDALRAGKHLAVANKECFVAGGRILQAAMAASDSLVVPVDSEHSSVYQCLSRRGSPEAVRRVIITASGGPFLDTPLEQLSSVTPEMAVRHPRWNMGKKISVDSATLMNKGLEVIEASVLFALPPDQIEVLINPQSIVHGLVEYDDGTTLAALYMPDMKVPIAYALKVIAARASGLPSGASLPAMASGHSLLDLARLGTLRFLDPDPERFPALPLCYRALAIGDGAEAVLSAANEVAVAAFLDGQIGYGEIVPAVDAAVTAWESAKHAHSMREISDVILVDSWGRKFASELLARRHCSSPEQGTKKHSVCQPLCGEEGTRNRARGEGCP